MFENFFFKQSKNRLNRHHSTRSPSPVDYNDIQLKERNLKKEVQMLAYQRDSLITELQQLHEAKPILAQAYTVRS